MFSQTSGFLMLFTALNASSTLPVARCSLNSSSALLVAGSTFSIPRKSLMVTLKHTPPPSATAAFLQTYRLGTDSPSSASNPAGIGWLSCSTIRSGEANMVNTTSPGVFASFLAFLVSIPLLRSSVPSPEDIVVGAPPSPMSPDADLETFTDAAGAPATSALASNCPPVTVCTPNIMGTSWSQACASGTRPVCAKSKLRKQSASTSYTTITVCVVAEPGRTNSTLTLVPLQFTLMDSMLEPVGMSRTSTFLPPVGPWLLGVRPPRRHSLMNPLEVETAR
mmetsp:Transcript_2774/g.6751  ORF Transcript_2774/g.6751 Transcript_2774/m.6751 type:complete len:279 (-) Transcript_2774:502-1338(-)